MRLIELEAALAYARVMEAVADSMYRRLPPGAQVASRRHLLELGSGSNRVFNLGVGEPFIDTDEDPPDRPNPSLRNVLRAGFQPAFVLRVFESSTP